MDINEKKDYIILDDFKGDYAIAKYEIKKIGEKETKNYVGVIDKDLNEVLPFKLRYEGWETYCSNARIEYGEWVEDETRYYYIEEMYKYISEGIYLDLKEKKVINLKDGNAYFSEDIKVIDFDEELNLLTLKSEDGYGLGDINGNIILKPQFEEFFELRELKDEDKKFILAITSGDVYYKINLETLEFEKAKGIPKSSKSDNEDTKSYNRYKEELNSMSLNNVNVNIEYSDNHICFSTTERKKKYSIKDYDKYLIKETIKKFSLPSGEYIFFPRIDSCSWNSNVIVLNKDLEEILNTDIDYCDYTSLETNVANTNFFKIVASFSSPLGCSITNHIYDENFKLIGQFDDYERVNVHEILSNGSIFNLITKEARDYSPLTRNENTENTSHEVHFLDISDLIYTVDDDEDDYGIQF